jgi:carbon storage regulator CsrA
MQKEKKVLVVSRKVGEVVVIGEPTNPLGEVEIVKVEGGKVRIAFRFPEDVKINREEVALTK